MPTKYLGRDALSSTLLGCRSCRNWPGFNRNHLGLGRHHPHCPLNVGHLYERRGEGWRNLLYDIAKLGTRVWRLDWLDIRIGKCSCDCNVRSRLRRNLAAAPMGNFTYTVIALYGTLANWLLIWQMHDIMITGGKLNDIRIISCITVACLLGIALIGTEWESKVSFG